MQRIRRATARSRRGQPSGITGRRGCLGEAGAPAGEGAEEGAVGAGDVAPGALAQREDERVDEAHQSETDCACEHETVAGLSGIVVVVHHAVIDEGNEPDEDVDDGVHEHETELAVDAGALLR